LVPGAVSLLRWCNLHLHCIFCSETPWMSSEGKGELLLVGQGLSELPASVCSSAVTKVDLTDNNVRTGANFDKLPSLTEIILDKNGVEKLVGFPVLSKVVTLWINNNKIKDLSEFMDSVVKFFPNLTYLSMLKNPACPNVYFSDGEAEAYQRYRYYVIHRLKHLKFLDASPITPSERKEGELRGKFMIVAKPVAEEESKEEPSASRPAPTIVPGAKPPKVATFLAKGKPRYDGSNSEGNRFIVNEDL